MTFSIIVPVFNAEKYLRTCVESICVQNFNDYEIILINDGSTDESLQLCLVLQKEFGHKILVLDQENGGASSARNAGIKNAIGQFLLFVDSDDYWQDATFLDNLDLEISNYPKLDIVLFGAVTENSINGKIRQRVCFTEQDITHLRNSSPLSAAKYLMKVRKFPSASWSLSVRKSFVESNELFFEEGISAEDIDWIIGCYYNNCFTSALPNTVYHYHEQREGSVTNSAGEKTVVSLLWIVKKWNLILMKKEQYFPLRQFLAFHFSTIILAYQNIHKDRRDLYRAEIIENMHSLDVLSDNRGKLVRYLYNLLGVDSASYLLSNIYNLFLRIK